MKKIGVIGIGSPLRRDDGIGIVLLEQLQNKKHTLPKGIELIDGGTGGMNLLHVLARFDTVLLIDAVDFQGKPGETRMFTLEEIQSKKIPVTVSTHNPDFLNVLRLSKELNELPDHFFIYGVQPKDISFGVGLTSELKKTMDVILHHLHQELTRILSS